MIKAQKDSLRALAYQVLETIEEKAAFADRALDALLKKHPDLADRDRRLVTELVYGTLRRQGSLDQSLKNYVNMPLSKLDPALKHILRLGAYQILFLDRVPDHAAVNEAVVQARRICHGKTGSLVNAVLRSLCRQKDQELSRLTHRSRSHAVDFPVWLHEIWRAEMAPVLLQKVYAALLKPPRTWLRVNTLKTSRTKALESLNAEGYSADPHPDLPWTLCLRSGGDIRKSTAFRKGWCLQQDIASQLIVPLLAPKPGERILDLCAAPGIKTTQIGENMNNAGQIIAMDNKLARVREMQRLCGKGGLTLTLPLCADATRSPFAPVTTDALFDRVLVDAPCSGLGILRRNPERKWRPPPEFAVLNQLQYSLLTSAARLLRPGGILVYSTCTVHRYENEAFIEKYLDDHKEFVLENAADYLPDTLRDLCSPSGYYCSWSRPEAFDLFFGARLRKK